MKTQLQTKVIRDWPSFQLPMSELKFGVAGLEDPHASSSAGFPLYDSSESRPCCPPFFSDLHRHPPQPCTGSAEPQPSRSVWATWFEYQRDELKPRLVEEIYDVPIRIEGFGSPEKKRGRIWYEAFWFEFWVSQWKRERERERDDSERWGTLHMNLYRRAQERAVEM